MNLFILSLDPARAAEEMMDKHVNKILLEAVQMLCTAMHIVEPELPENIAGSLYKLAHKNHPVTIWCRTSRANFIWTLDLVDALHTEWKYRYGHPETKIHKSYQVAQILRANIPADDKSHLSHWRCRTNTNTRKAMPSRHIAPTICHRRKGASLHGQKGAALLLGGFLSPPPPPPLMPPRPLYRSTFAIFATTCNKQWT